MEKSQYTIMYQVEKKHFWYTVMGRISEFLLRTYLPRNPERKILDAGCGTGGGLLFLKKYGQTHGVDISSYAVSLCKRRGLTNVAVGSIDDLPYSPGFFDAVTCFDVLGQQEVGSDKKALREFGRVLKAHGLLLIRIAAYDWLRSQHDRSVHAKHRYTTDEVSKLLNMSGFEVLRITYANTLLFPVVIARRLLGKIFPKKDSDKSDVQHLPFFLNSFLTSIFSLEYQLLKRISLPFGLSVIAVARKKDFRSSV